LFLERYLLPGGTVSSNKSCFSLITSYTGDDEEKCTRFIDNNNNKVKDGGGATRTTFGLQSTSADDQK
jgi:hypothetical protein